MTLQQLKYAIEIEKCGSILKAANKLFISQPNLSNVIKDLETEFGIIIFKRNNRGVQVTEKGRTFLIYARSLLNQYEEMKHLSTDTNSSSFTLIAHKYSPIMDSFAKYVKLNCNKEKLNLELINAHSLEIIDKVYKQEADLGIFVILNSMLDNFIYYLKDRDLSFTTLGKLSCYIHVRKGHPILKHKNLLFNELHKYPFVHFRDNFYKELAGTSLPEEFNFINHDKKIVTFDRNLNSNFVNETDAYFIGCKSHPNSSNYFDLVRIPIPDVYGNIGYIHGTNHPISMESQTYINILKEELNGLVL